MTMNASKHRAGMSKKSLGLRALNTTHKNLKHVLALAHGFTERKAAFRNNFAPARFGSTFLSLAFLLISFVALALDPSLPPGGNFDLSKWKLTLPDANTTEITGVNLGKGFVDPLYSPQAA